MKIVIFMELEIDIPLMNSINLKKAVPLKNLKKKRYSAQQCVYVHAT